MGVGGGGCPLLQLYNNIVGVRPCARDRYIAVRPTLCICNICNISAPLLLSESFFRTIATNQISRNPDIAVPKQRVVRRPEYLRIEVIN